MTAEIRQLGSMRILYDSSCLPSPEENLLDTGYWQSLGLITGEFTGRGRALVVESPAGPAVLRRFLRGGLIARVNRSRYLFTGWEGSRGLHEWRLLYRMYSAGLPVPRPLAASCERRGPWYQAGLLTALIPESRSMVDQLQEDSLIPDDWERIGQTIRRFHDHGVAHADLNARNILLDTDKRVFLVDFDRGRMVLPETVWRQRMLRRLKRSLAGFIDAEVLRPGWRRLMAGYLN